MTWERAGQQGVLGLRAGSPRSSMRWCSLHSSRPSQRWVSCGTQRGKEGSCSLGSNPPPMDSPRQMRSGLLKTFCSIEDDTAVVPFVSRASAGQSTVEGAILLPTVMLLLGLLLQPACLLYTRMVMRSAAAECARVLATAASGDEAACKAFVLRRLAAVPEASPFHVGGRDDWDISLDYSEGSSSVSVSIVGHLRPLPLLGMSARAFGRSKGDLVELEVKVAEQVRPEWLGGSYDSWLKMWG